MKTFIAQTGHAKDLSRAELIALLGECIIDEVPDGIVFKADIADAVDFLNHCGGMVRLLQVVREGPSQVPLNVTNWMEEALLERLHDVEGKKRFGLSIHPKDEKNLNKTLINLKKNLKNELGNLRFVNKDFQNISSAAAWHEKMLEKNAAEYHLFKGAKRWYLGLTLAIQDLEAYSERDFGRPARDAKNGMFPPKLAQILINLTSAPEAAIYDPFCGGGTVLQEAWLQGRETQGSDMVEKQITDAQQNLEWLKNRWNLEGPIPALNVKDATQLKPADLPKNDFAVVTETWLGPPLFKPLTALERPKVEREILKLYEHFFKNLAKIVRKETTVVFTAPYFKDGVERHFIPGLQELLERFGTIVPLGAGQPSLMFERNDQLTAREVWKVIITPSHS